MKSSAISTLALVVMLAGSVLSMSLFAGRASAQVAAVMTLATDKAAYNPGDPIVASGNVGTIQPGVLVAFTLIAPNGAIQIPLAVTPDPATGAYTGTISKYTVPKEGTYRLVASYGKVKAEVKFDIGKAQPDKGVKNCDVTKYVCVTVTKPNAVSKYMTDSGYGLQFNPGDTVTLPLWVSRERSGSSYLVQSATLTVTGPGATKAFDKTYDSDHFYRYWSDVQTMGIGGAKFYTQTFKLPDNAPAGTYTAKIYTSVPNKPQSLLEDTITFTVGKPLPKGSGVLVTMSGSGPVYVKLQSIKDQKTNAGPLIARFTMDFNPRPSAGYKLTADNGWACKDTGGMIDCVGTKGPLGPGKKVTFKVNRPLDGVSWSAYDAAGTLLDSGRAKR